MENKLMTLEKLRRYKVWLQRIGCSRGFGVQSPSAYSFVRYVINEHYPYYAYEELANAHPEIGAMSRKKGEFLFRLSNFLQYECCFLSEDVSPCCDLYIRTGCKKTDVRSFEERANVAGAALYVLSAGGIGTMDIPDFIDGLPENSVLFIDGVLKNEQTKKLWDTIKAHGRISFSFDMYYCGVAFMNPKTPKQNFKINF